VECIFCDIVAGAEASRVYEDDQYLGFMDLRPVTPGHLLVVPKRHAAYLAELSSQEAAGLAGVAHRLAAAVRHSALQCEGVNLFLADGAAAFQHVFHVHLHVFPRFAGDGFKLQADWKPVSRADLDESAEAVRAGLRVIAEAQG
jgi:histidine triad (HIT) family protein